jgi:hypothetical protein
MADFHTIIEADLTLALPSGVGRVVATDITKAIQSGGKSVVRALEQQAIGAGVSLVNSLLGAGGAVGGTVSSESTGQGFDITAFRNHFSNYHEVAKTDKFDVSITIPQQVADGSGYGMRELALQCEVSELPGRDISLIEYRHYGFTKRIPHINQYNHITFTFFCTGDMIEKKLFDRWMDLMIPAQTGLVNYAEDDSGLPVYESDIVLNQYTNSGALSYSVTLVSALPTTVAALGQSWADDSVHRLSVTFAYLKWTSNQTIMGTNQTSSPINDIQTNFSNFSPKESNAAAAVNQQFGQHAGVDNQFNNNPGIGS